MAGSAWAALPSGWTDADIGSPYLAGSASYASGVWTVTGGGGDIWDNADQFNFASTNATGDRTMIVRVTSLQNSDPGSGWSKAGLMFRNDSSAGSANVSVVATAGQGVSFQWRSTGGGSSSYTSSSGITAPVWLKLARIGTSFTGYYSTDGNNWVQVKNQQVALNNAVMAGFDVTAHNNSALNTATFTDFSLVATTNSTPTPGTNAPVTIALDALANRHPISPLIYGLNWASASQLLDLNYTLNRGGGNAETRYNWLLNAHNRAGDWYFESLSDGSSTPGAAADSFITETRNGSAEPMITIPMIGWMPKLGPNREDRYSFSIAKYGAQTAHDPYRADAGNGVSQSTGQNITGNDPNDANFPTNVVFQQGFVQHLTNQWGVSTNGGVRFYIMDNEETIWEYTHRDVHPIGPTMEEIRDDVIAYGGMVKSYDPNAAVVMGEEWGWNGFLNSGYDIQNPGNTDRAAHGGADYTPWLLNQIHQHDLSTGRQTIDIFTIHFYPQEGSVGYGTTDPATDLLRNRATRALWDSNYVDESWINAKMYMIPRMKNWIAANYPGLKTGITEYTWGAENYMGGAIGQADVLGIFGREGLYLAARWGTPDPGTPTYKAMKLYRNYDGNKSVFGDISVQTTVPQPDSLSAFGAVRTSDGALTLMVLNKDLTNATPLVAGVSNFPAAGAVQRWQLTSANAHLSDLALTGGVLSDMLPAQSITLFVVPSTSSFSLQAGSNSPPDQLGIWLHGQAGQTYWLQSSADLVHWSNIDTNVLETNSFEFFVARTNSAHMFYRGQLSQ
jgi:regulation of enolase protein 1 (concanavalin A-like superfamily)